MSDDTFVYVDNSNVFHEGQRYAAEQRGEDRSAFRLHFKNFLELLANGRSIREVVWGGSIPPGNDALWAHLEACNVKPDLIPRADSGEHNTVDHRIQLRMHRHVRKNRDDPGTIVLATGDGAGYYQGDGFLYDAEGFVQDGWELEIMSWQHCCNGKLRDFAQRNGVFVALDHYYDQISFIAGGRVVRDFTSR